MIIPAAPFLLHVLLFDGRASPPPSPITPLSCVSHKSGETLKHFIECTNPEEVKFTLYVRKDDQVLMKSLPATCHTVGTAEERLRWWFGSWGHENGLGKLVCRP